MNSLGSGLVWCGASVAVGVHWRNVLFARAAPRPGGRIAGGAGRTCDVIALSLAALSPWPTWWRLPIAPKRRAGRHRQRSMLARRNPLRRI